MANRPLPPAVTVHLPLAFPGQRIGIMGGSFNPPHDGHLIVARTAMRRLRLHQLWWVVTPGNPLKLNNGLPPQAQRMAACRRLIGPDARMHVTGFEAELGSPYTAISLKFLLRRYRSVRFAWVMGADNLAQFHRWQDWRSIAQHVPIAVVDRPGWRHRAVSSPAAQTMRRAKVAEAKAGTLLGRKAPAWTFLTSKLSPLSSTELRRFAPELSSP